jgi:hypothetical protein
MPSTNEDWIMKVEGNSVYFNTILTSKCPFEFYKSIALHEFFHLDVQRVPNKEDATKIKDDFGNELMNLIDIEADYYTALYFKEVLNFSLVKYLQLYYNGNKVFSDKWVRSVKFERFIGSILSICKLYLDNPKNRPEKSSNCDLYLPKIGAIYTENSLHILVVRKEHIYFDEIKAHYEDFVTIKGCYMYNDDITEKQYVKRLVIFAYKAFGRKTPKYIFTEIEKLT